MVVRFNNIIWHLITFYGFTRCYLLHALSLDSCYIGVHWNVGSPHFSQASYKYWRLWPLCFLLMVEIQTNIIRKHIEHLQKKIHTHSFGDKGKSTTWMLYIIFLWIKIWLFIPSLCSEFPYICRCNLHHRCKRHGSCTAWTIKDWRL